mgnify:CR=1 FL=1
MSSGGNIAAPSLRHMSRPAKINPKGQSQVLDVIVTDEDGSVPVGSDPLLGAAGESPMESEARP